jgi:hypothetical protein
MPIMPHGSRLAGKPNYFSTYVLIRAMKRESGLLVERKFVWKCFGGIFDAVY